jgi:outer membrane protein assembly factor BamB
MRQTVRLSNPLRLLASAVALLPALALADEDGLEPPWSTVHADLSGSAATSGIAYGLGQGPLEEKWRLDVAAEGQDRPGGRSSITFDKDGNLYWISSTGGGTGGMARLVSASPAGAIRWSANDGAGNLHSIGSVFGGASPVVGEARVYAAGDLEGSLAVAAYDKATGKNLWTADLSPSTVSLGQLLTPILYQGKLYVLGLNGSTSKDVHRVDAETGIEDWFSTVDEVAIGVVGQAAFVPDAFGAGVHGLYFNGDSGAGADGVAEVYGIRLAEDGATLGWMAEGGKVARSHVIHSETTGLLYTFTWSDYGAEAYVFDPASGFLASHQNSLRTGHGFYDVGALDFDGVSLIAGGFDGNILRYADGGGGVLTDEVLFKGGTSFAVPYWGETRVLGQLLQAPGGNSVLITGTNSFQCCGSHVIALDVTEKKLLWQYDTRNHFDHQFLYAGGPLAGPDGKVYYFERHSDGSSTLVAIGLAEKEPAPTAGFIVVEAGGLAAGTAAGGADPCVKGGEAARFDASCGTGKDLVYRWLVDPPDGVTVLPRADGDPSAQIRFQSTGDLEVTLEVESAGGTAQCKRVVCVAPAPPRCQLTVTDLAGGPIDSADDNDAIPCLAAGATALADGGGSTGGDLEYTFSVSPAAGVTVVQGAGPLASQAQLTVADPGIYKVGLTLKNSQGTAPCGAKTICVKTAVEAKRFQRGDCNADRNIDLSDAVVQLGILFLGSPAASCQEACDSNGDGTSDLSDAIYLLTNLFLGGPNPPAPFPACGASPGQLFLGCGQSTC